MAVYVDDMRAPYGRLILCHMVADSLAELHEMADRIGVARRWFQGPRPHYDISLGKRALAVAAGALEISQRKAAVISSACRDRAARADVEPQRGVMKGGE